MMKSVFMWISPPLFLCTILFHFKHEVQILEDQIQRIKFEIVETQESIDVLHAEWGHLTDPQRLTQLNDKFLKLEPIEPKQLITLADLPERKIDKEIEVESDINKKLNFQGKAKTMQVAQRL